MSNLVQEKIKVTLSFNIVLNQTASGWWEAWHGKLGTTSASTKDECIRILKERALSL